MFESLQKNQLPSIPAKDEDLPSQSALETEEVENSFIQTYGNNNHTHKKKARKLYKKQPVAEIGYQVLYVLPKKQQDADKKPSTQETVFTAVDQARANRAASQERTTQDKYFRTFNGIFEKINDVALSIKDENRFLIGDITMYAIGKRFLADVAKLINTQFTSITEPKAANLAGSSFTKFVQLKFLQESPEAFLESQQNTVLKKHTDKVTELKQTLYRLSVRTDKIALNEFKKLTHDVTEIDQVIDEKTLGAQINKMENSWGRILFGWLTGENKKLADLKQLQKTASTIKEHTALLNKAIDKQCEIELAKSQFIDLQKKLLSHADLVTTNELNAWKQGLKLLFEDKKLINSLVKPKLEELTKKVIENINLCLKNSDEQFAKDTKNILSNQLAALLTVENKDRTVFDDELITHCQKALESIHDPIVGLAFCRKLSECIDNHDGLKLPKLLSEKYMQFSAWGDLRTANTGYYLSLSSVTSFDKLHTELLKKAPTLIKDNNNHYKMWGYKNDTWQLTDISSESLQLPNEWTFTQDLQQVPVSCDSNLYRALQAAHDPIEKTFVYDANIIHPALVGLLNTNMTTAMKNDVQSFFTELSTTITPRLEKVLAAIRKAPTDKIADHELLILKNQLAIFSKEKLDALKNDNFAMMVAFRDKLVAIIKDNIAACTHSSQLHYLTEAIETIWPDGILPRYATIINKSDQPFTWQTEKSLGDLPDNISCYEKTALHLYKPAITNLTFNAKEQAQVYFLPTHENTELKNAILQKRNAFLKEHVSDSDKDKLAFLRDNVGSNLYEWWKKTFLNNETSLTGGTLYKYGAPLIASLLRTRYTKIEELFKAGKCTEAAWLSDELNAEIEAVARAFDQKLDALFHKNETSKFAKTMDIAEDPIDISHLLLQWRFLSMLHHDYDVTTHAERFMGKTMISKMSHIIAEEPNYIHYFLGNMSEEQLNVLEETFTRDPLYPRRDDAKNSDDAALKQSALLQELSELLKQELVDYINGHPSHYIDDNLDEKITNDTGKVDNKSVQNDRYNLQLSYTNFIEKHSSDKLTDETALAQFNSALKEELNKAINYLLAAHPPQELQNLQLQLSKNPNTIAILQSLPQSSMIALPSELVAYVRKIKKYFANHVNNELDQKARYKLMQAHADFINKRLTANVMEKPVLEQFNIELKEELSKAIDWLIENSPTEELRTLQQQLRKNPNTISIVKSLSQDIIMQFPVDLAEYLRTIQKHFTNRFEKNSLQSILDDQNMADTNSFKRVEELKDTSVYKLATTVLSDDDLCTVFKLHKRPIPKTNWSIQPYMKACYKLPGQCASAIYNTAKYYTQSSLSYLSWKKPQKQDDKKNLRTKESITAKQREVHSASNFNTMT